MRQATRRLLKMRPGARVISKVEFRPHPDAREGQCFDNAWREQERSGNDMVAGWIVGEYEPGVDSTPVMYHFWNRTPDGVYYDTSPYVAEGKDVKFEFVYDSDVYYESLAFSRKNQVELKGDMHMPPSLKIRSNSVLMCVREPDVGTTGRFRWVDIYEQPIEIGRMLAIRLHCMREKFENINYDPTETYRKVYA